MKYDKILDEVIFLIDEYYAGSHTPASFRHKVATMIAADEISAEAADKVMKKLFNTQAPVVKKSNNRCDNPGSSGCGSSKPSMKLYSSPFSGGGCGSSPTRGC